MIKVYSVINHGWACCWCYDYVGDQNATGSFQTSCTNYIDDLIDVFDKIVDDVYNPNGYYNDYTQAVGNFTVHKFSGRNVSLIVNHSRVLFHVDVEVLKAIVEATKQAVIECNIRWKKEDI